MRKIFIVLFSIAFLSLIAGGIVSAQTTNKPSFDINCVKTAVDKRETAIQSTLDAFYNSVKSAFQARKTALLTAWGITDAKQRQVAIKDAWKTFTTAYKTARKTFNTARAAAWKQFATDRKACKAPATGENQGSDLSF